MVVLQNALVHVCTALLRTIRAALQASAALRADAVRVSGASARRLQLVLAVLRGIRLVSRAVRQLPVRVVVEVLSLVLLLEWVKLSVTQRTAMVALVTGVLAVVSLGSGVSSLLTALHTELCLQQLLSSIVRRVAQGLATPLVARGTALMCCARLALRNVQMLYTCPQTCSAVLPLAGLPVIYTQVGPVAPLMAELKAQPALAQLHAVAAQRQRGLLGRIRR